MVVKLKHPETVQLRSSFRRDQSEGGLLRVPQGVAESVPQLSQN